MGLSAFIYPWLEVAEWLHLVLNHSPTYYYNVLI